MTHDCQPQMELHCEVGRSEQKSVWQEAFNGQEMGSMEELRNTAPVPKPVLQVRFASTQHILAAIIFGRQHNAPHMACMHVRDSHAPSNPTEPFSLLVTNPQLIACHTASECKQMQWLL